MGSGTSSQPGASSSPQPATGEHVQSLLATGLDRYALQRLLGVGGMGEVYQGVHRTIEKQVAIKVLAYEHRHDPSLNERFVEEAKAASRIRHDNVVDITDFGQSPQGCSYFVMEYLEGEDLAATLRREGPMPWGRVQHIVLQLLSALHAAHGLGIVHRDIKPANCLRFTKNGDPDFIKVLDFGIARISRPQQGERLTQAGTIMGTAEYMSPEQARGEEVDPRTDLYAVGVMLFQMVTGQLPFAAKSPVEILAKHLSLPAPVASHVAPVPLPAGVDAIIARALGKEPEERWPSAEQLAAAVAAIPAGPISHPALAGMASNPSYSALAGMASNPSHPALAGMASNPSHPALAGMVSNPSHPALAGMVSNPSNPSWATPVTHSSAPTSTDVDNATLINNKSPGRGATALAVVAAVLGLGVLGVGASWLLRDDAPSSADPVGAAPTSPAVPDSPAEPTPTPTPTVTAPRCPEGMVLVEAGSFFMGSDDEKTGALQTARPSHKVRLGSYCIGIDEITVDQFRECSTKGECRRAYKDSWYPQGRTDEDAWLAARKALSVLCNERSRDRGSHPINCVTWAQARDYCEFRGQRLPTEAEWEFAARGSDGRVFPWGDDPPTHEHGNLCNAECVAWRKDVGLPPEGMLSDADDGWFGTAPVGSFPEGTTQHGLRDIVGNVFEWTASDFVLYDEHPEGLTAREGKVIRGGAFNSAFAMFAEPALRFPSDPKTHSHGIGFRCAADPQGG